MQILNSVGRFRVFLEADDTQGGAVGTGDGATGGDTGTPEGGDLPNSKVVFTDEQQAEIKRLVDSESDRKVTAAQKKFAASAKAEQEEALAEAAKQAKEDKLLEKKEYKELAESREAELKELKALDAQRERLEKVEKLLNKHGIESIVMRDVLRAGTGELEVLDTRFETFEAEFEKAVEAAVDKRLHTPTPPNVPGAPADSGDVWALIKAAKAAGNMDEAVRLKNTIELTPGGKS